MALTVGKRLSLMHKKTWLTVNEAIRNFFFFFSPKVYQSRKLTGLNKNNNKQLVFFLWVWKFFVVAAVVWNFISCCILFIVFGKLSRVSHFCRIFFKELSIAYTKVMPLHEGRDYCTCLWWPYAFEWNCYFLF